MKIGSISLLLVSFMLVSCVMMDGPENNSSFRDVKDLSEFAGSYRNLGDSGDPDSNIYLSSLIWPYDKMLNPKSINIITIKKISKNKLEIKAISSGHAVKEEVFTEGKDFKLSDGTITLKEHTETANDIIIGASYSHSIIGIDKQGNGKYRTSGGAAGVVLLVIPVAAIGRDDVRFPRIK